jgi:hypothetical protein
MTNHSVVRLPTATDRHGSTLANQCSPADFQVPEAIVLKLWLASETMEYPAQLRALARAKHEGTLAAIPALADKAAAALVPVDHKELINRLTMLGMSMANGKDAEQIRAWLHETARLLSDLPKRVLFDAIDDCVKEPGRVFVPSVGEIREKAAASLQRQERIAARLRKLANLIAEGVELPEWVEPTPGRFIISPAPEPEKEVCTPEQAAAILAEFGLSSSSGAKLAGMLQPQPERTRADYIAEGRDPPPLKPKDTDDWSMMA